MIITARFVVPVESPPIEDAAVQFENGFITAVGKRREVSRKSGEELIDYGDAVVCPGFVNAHTHLDLTDLAGKIPPTPDFAGWLSALMRHSADHSPTQESVSAAVREGVRQSLAAGVTTVGDITRFPNWTREVLRGSALRSVSFGEVIAVGKRRGLVHERLSAACASTLRSDRLAIGISPHSPYTVEPEALRLCAAEAANRQLPICVHAAESREEVEFTTTGGGPLRDFLRSIDVWDDQVPTPGCSPIEFLHRVGLLSPSTIVAHANYVGDNDITLIAQSGASVAYCPRTHAAFGHPPHRFMDMMGAGINVCIGTDSLASNPSLSVLEELQHVSIAHPELDARVLLLMGTKAAAAGLGLGDKSGSIKAGTSAALALISLADRARLSRWSDILTGSATTTAVCGKRDWSTLT